MHCREMPGSLVAELMSSREGRRGVLCQSNCSSPSYVSDGIDALFYYFIYVCPVMRTWGATVLASIHVVCKLFTT